MLQATDEPDDENVETTLPPLVETTASFDETTHKHRKHTTTTAQ